MADTKSVPDDGRRPISRRAIMAGGAAASVAPLLATPAALAQPPAAQVKVGVVIDLSGPTAGHGKRQLMGIEFATEQVNGISGGPTLQLVVRDTSGDVATATRHAEELIDREQVVAIIGTSTVRTALAVYEITKARAIPMISPISTISTFDWPYIYCSGTLVEEYVETIVADLGQQQLSKVALLFEESLKDADVGTELVRQTAAAGIEIVGTETHGNDAQDLVTPLAALTAKEPAAIVVVTFPPFNGYAARDARGPDVGWTGPLYFSPAAGTPVFLEGAGAAANGVRVVAPWLLVAKHAPDNLPNKQVITDFVAAFEADPARGRVGAYVGYGADAVYLTAAAFAATTDPPTANTVLQHVGHIGVTGVHVLSPTRHIGILRGGLTLVTADNGEWIPVNTPPNS